MGKKKIILLENSSAWRRNYNGNQGMTMTGETKRGKQNRKKININIISHKKTKTLGLKM